MPLSQVLFFWISYRLSSVLRGTKHATITFSPHELRFEEVVLTILTMVVKSIFSAARGSKITGSTQSADKLILSAPLCLSEKDIARYHRAVCSSTTHPFDIASSSLPLFLSAVTEPAMLLLLTSPACPINPLGAVNVRNRFELLRPDLCHLDSFTDSCPATLVASVRNTARLVKRGVEYDLEVSIMMPDKIKASSVNVVRVYRQVFIMLEFRKMKRTMEKRASNPRKPYAHIHVSSVSRLSISFSKNDPLKWAALCKDYNFIHLSSLAAKLVGFPGKLAHGNHVVAKAMQQLEEDNARQDDARQDLGNKPTWMEVHFKRPVVVPSNLNVEVQSKTNGTTTLVFQSRSRVCCRRVWLVVTASIPIAAFTQQGAHISSAFSCK